jgi:hypothetical protein
VVWVNVYNMKGGSLRLGSPGPLWCHSQYYHVGTGEIKADSTGMPTEIAAKQVMLWYPGIYGFILEGSRAYGWPERRAIALARLKPSRNDGCAAARAPESGALRRAVRLKLVLDHWDRSVIRPFSISTRRVYETACC